ncbi:leukocyte receptor cluster member 9 isoform X3 [Neoarius graeffei]|uniref:leukocyte receptor cluster member 9 isoform X3 n=1 Tax=Neoarius graeffei TaxID=443677 RepID=UPI00298D5B32|nr:leukocyte receptor cluster member 9 isoform X3 [Neoarius graeffei]
MEAAEGEKTGTAQAPADASKQDLDVCKFFLKGRCHFGDKCRLSHSSPTPFADHNLVQTEGEKEHKKRKTKKRSGKTDKAKYEESKGPEKKLRMRTADDVISRILWDTSVDPADFIVGHLDRFLGLLERPFSDFSWDTQLCDCDYSEEMTIPRHRIQYFTYKGQRVWDRDSRTDHVFGSTGQSVISPFDRGDQSQDAAENGEELSGETNEHGSVKHSLMGAADEDTLSDAGETLDCSTNIQTDKDHEDVSLAQEAERLSISPGDKQTTMQDEWTDSWDKEEVKEKEMEPVQAIPQGPPPGRQRRKPTHFICFRVDSPAALRAFQLLQRKVLTHLPQSEPLWVKPESLHVTLSLLFLQGPSEVFAASELLRSIAKNFYKPPISVFFTPRLRHFSGKVLHIAPKPLPDIQNLNAPLQEAFREKGWLHRDSRNPTYHLTLAKVTEADAERIFEDVWQIKLDKQLNFGKLIVDKLYLCVNDVPRAVNGFYETVCSVQLPTV